MDVRCERCSTEYEFDDALVSGRGTTVKCTNCGHKFKIRRSDGDFSEDFWNVQTGDGRTLVFTSLRELQRAIQTNLVDRQDLLSRGGLKQKAIGQIPELAPFFEQRDQRKSQAPTGLAAVPSVTPAPAVANASAPPASRDSAETMVAARPAIAAATSAAASANQTRSSRPPPPPGASAPPLVAPPRQRMSTRPDFPPMPPERSELPAPDGGRAGTSRNRTLIGGVEPVVEPRAEARSGSVPDSDPTRVLESTRAPSSHPTRVREPAPAPAPAPAASAAPIPAPPAMRERLGSLRPSEAPPSTDREPEPDTERFARGHESAAPAPAAAPQVHTRTQPMDPLYLPKNTPPPPVFEASSPLPAPTGPVLRTMNLDDENSDGMRGRSPSLSDAPASMGRKRSVGGFIVAFVVLAAVALIGAVWAKDHLGRILGNKPPPVATTDPRVTTFLAAGEKALAEGNVEIAKESFDKASALAEKDPRVLLDLARLAAVRADLPWLKSRLLAPEATDEIRLTKDELNERGAAARKAADDALAVAPDDAAALRAKIDALRIGGDRDGARALVARVASSASQPETAYVLATLDLAENEPLWSTVIERLRVAASAESGPGRGRAALAYALARSGDVAAAKSEVERLASMSRHHPLLSLLRAFADRAKPAAKADAGAGDGGTIASDNARADGGHLRPGERGDPGERGEKGAKGAPSGDARQLVAQGEKARAKGDFDRAQMLFAAALDRNPNDTEALNGLAAIAHARRDLNGARASYKRVLSINPSYVPALVGVGDVDWESGDRASAMKTYKEIVERFPEGTYPARVKQRVDAASGTGGSSGTAPAPAPADTGGGG